MIYKVRSNVITFFDDNSSMVSKAKHEATKRTGPKISPPKQMFQRLTISLAEVKTGINSKNL